MIDHDIPSLEFQSNSGQMGYVLHENNVFTGFGREKICAILMEKKENLDFYGILKLENRILSKWKLIKILNFKIQKNLEISFFFRILLVFYTKNVKKMWTNWKTEN